MGRKRKEEHLELPAKSNIDISKYNIKIFDVRPKCSDLPSWYKSFSGWSVETCIEYFEKKYGKIKGTIYCYKNEVYIPYEKD